ncbi:MAG: hypothetical protein ACK42G_05750 [Candidatus Kapaibacteriota bacterium]
MLISPFLVFHSISQNNGNFVYVLDDPYIHMAIAKNFSQFGVWGVDRYAFSPASSSILWSLLISFFYFFLGVNDWIPLILNIIFALLLLYAIFEFLSRLVKSNSLILFILLFVIFVTPFFLLVFTGQEHLLHTLITLLFAYKTAMLVSNKSERNSTGNNISPFDIVQMLFLSFLLVAIRYEGLFLLFIACVFLLIKKQYRLAILLALCGVLPVLIFGFISIASGGYFLPNSVLLKGNLPNLSTFRGILKFLGGFAAYQMVLNPEILLLFLVAISLLFFGSRSKSDFYSFPNIFVSIFILTLLLHLQFAKVGWFYRYEAYLIFLGIFAIVQFIFLNLSQMKNALNPRKILLPFLLFALIALLAFRGYSTFKVILPATKNIYEQQFQMGNYIKKYFNQSVVALNDIGYVNYIADIRCVDLWGLANFDVAKAKLNKIFDTRKISEISKKYNVTIAILYEIWFEQYGGLPKDWQLVEKWEIKNNVVCGDKVVSFFAVDLSQTEKLKQSLKEFRTRLPKDVKVFTFE